MPTAEQVNEAFQAYSDSIDRYVLARSDMARLRKVYDDLHDEWKREITSKEPKS